MAEEGKEHPEQHEKKGEKQAHAYDPEKKELRSVRISTIAFSFAGIAMGFLSYVLNFDMLSVILGFALLFALMYALKKALKKKPKQLLGDAFAYLLIWLAAWTFLFNM